MNDPRFCNDVHIAVMMKKQSLMLVSYHQNLLMAHLDFCIERDDNAAINERVTEIKATFRDIYLLWRFL